MKNIKAGILSVHPAPYRDMVFAEVFRRSNIGIEILFYFDIDDGHKEWNYEKPEYHCQVLHRAIPILNKDFVHLGLIKKLISSNYDVLVIPGYARVTSLLAIFFSLISKTPFVLNADNIIDHKRLSRRGRIKKFFISYILKKASAFWVPGKASRYYFESYGIPPEKIFEGAYCFNAKAIVEKIDAHRNQRTQIRKQYGIPDKSWCLLSVGKMIPNRCYIQLAHSMLRIPGEYPVHLILVGYGQDEITIRQLCRSNEQANITLVGAVPFSDLPAIYAAADVYIHPGREPYSTATEYAALAALPIIGSIDVGYIHELIGKGAKPLLINSGDQNEIINSILWTIDNRDEARFLGRINQKIAITRDVYWAADQVESAIFHAAYFV